MAKRSWAEHGEPVAVAAAATETHHELRVANANPILVRRSVYVYVCMYMPGPPKHPK